MTTRETLDARAADRAAKTPAAPTAKMVQALRWIASFDGRWVDRSRRALETVNSTTLNALISRGLVRGDRDADHVLRWSVTPAGLALI